MLIFPSAREAAIVTLENTRVNFPLLEVTVFGGPDKLYGRFGASASGVLGPN